jgi:hypothetical protein
MIQFVRYSESWNKVGDNVVARMKQLLTSTEVFSLKS